MYVLCLVVGYLCSGNVPCVVVIFTAEGRIVCAGIDKGRVICVGASGSVLSVVTGLSWHECVTA